MTSTAASKRPPAPSSAAEHRPGGHAEVARGLDVPVGRARPAPRPPRRHQRELRRRDDGDAAAEHGGQHEQRGRRAATSSARAPPPARARRRSAAGGSRRGRRGARRRRRSSDDRPEHAEEERPRPRAPSRCARGSRGRAGRRAPGRRAPTGRRRRRAGGRHGCDGGHGGHRRSAPARPPLCQRERPRAGAATHRVVCARAGVRLSGGLRLELDGAPLHRPRSRRGRGLLAWLALHPGPHARGQLAGRFWPDVLDASARTSLRAALTELRAPSATAPTAWSRPARRSRWTATAWGRRARVRRAGWPPATPRARSRRAPASCSTGIDDDWVHAARAEHAARAGEALARLAAAAAAGDHAAAVARAREPPRSTRSPRSPPAADGRASPPAGDRAAALTAYEQLAERLRADARHRAVAGDARAAARLRRRAACRRSRVPAPAAVARAGDAPFVGRARELARLAAAAGPSTRGGGRRLALLAGRAGHRQDAPGAALRRATPTCRRRSCSAAVGGAARRLRAVRRDPARTARRARRRRVALAGGAAPSSTGCAGARIARRPDPGVRARVFDAVDASLSALPQPVAADRRRPAVGRPGTLLRCRALLRSPRPAALLLSRTPRAAGAPATPCRSALADLRRDGALEDIALGGLRRDDVAALARAWLGDDATPARRGGPRAHAAATRSSRSELLRGLRDRDRREIPDERAPRDRRACARLGEEAGSCSAVAAALGEHVDLRRSRAPPASSAAAPEAALDELIAAQLLRRPPRRAAGRVPARARARGRLRRASTRCAGRACTALADALLALRRRPPRGGDRPPPRARRRPGRGGPVPRARGRARDGDGRLRAGGALPRQRSTRSTPRTPTATAGAAAARRRGEALLRAGDPAARAARFAQARAIARRTRDAPLLARAALGHGGLGRRDRRPRRRARRAARGGARRVGARPGARVGAARPPRGRALLRAARDRTEALSAEAVAPRAGRATRGRSPPRSTRATSRCGGRTAWTSGAPRPTR